MHDFRPHIVFRSGHSQTLAAHFIYGKVLPESARLHALTLPDGDQLMLHDDRPATWSDRDHVALMVHGVCGSHASSYMSRIAGRLNQRNVRTFRLDLRGCGAGSTVARHSYSGGCTGDLLAALQEVCTICPGSSLALIGFSLGGNIALKLAGQNSPEFPEAVTKMVAISPAIDLVATAECLHRGASRFYNRYFAWLLWKQWQVRLQTCPNLLMPPSARRLVKPPHTVKRFDDLLTAPLHGFRDAHHYYSECSAGRDLQRIDVPTIVLTAADDPVVPIGPFETAPRSAAVSLQITRHGGHMGYLSHRSGDPDRHWMDWRIVDWVVNS